MKKLKPYYVFGNHLSGKGKVVTVLAYNAAQALDRARMLYRDCRFNHTQEKYFPYNKIKV